MFVILRGWKLSDKTTSLDGKMQGTLILNTCTVEWLEVNFALKEM
jgi:hypothetical protein